MIVASGDLSHKLQEYGPYGFAPGIHSLANEEISLSQMTLSHQMIRLLIVEQLYRAMTILAGEPYHHE